MTKPIEPGCLCVVTGSISTPVNIGKLAVAVTRATYRADPAWLIKSLGQPFVGRCAETGVWSVGDLMYCLGRHLKRVDDPTGEDETLQLAGYPPADEPAQFRQAIREALVEVRRRREGKV